MQQELPKDDTHRRPEGASNEVVAAVGKFSEGFEKIERARGALYDLHQLIGGADKDIAEAADMLEQAGCTEQSTYVRRDIVGRNVLPGRWTFQIVEEFNEVYYRAVKAVEERLHTELMDGKRHVYESEMKERNRTHGKPGHEARP